MRNVTPAFMRALSADRRDFQYRAVITLSDNTVLNLDNEDLWEDGLKNEDAVSSESTFQVGAAIINQATLMINNIYDDFSAYDFTNAHVVLFTGLDDLDDDTSEEVKLGTYTMDEADYNGSIITLRCLDNMSKFDRPYTFELPTDDEIIYPATLKNIVLNACHNCGVPLATNSLNFPHNNYVVTNKPSGENTTYRQVISWAAQIAVCFARCNNDGELEIKWYDTDALEAAGNDLPAGAHLIQSSYSHKLSTDDVVITGTRVVKKITVEGSPDAYETYSSGASGYIVSVEGNDFIDGTHGQDVADWMEDTLAGVRFRKAEISHLSDPTIEAGDVAYFWDNKNNRYAIIVSSTIFSGGSSQRTVSAAETPAKNSQQRFSEATRNYVELRKQQVKDFNALAQRIAESGGLYESDVTVSGATHRWYHDKPDLEDSNIVMVFTTAGFTLCDDYKDKTEQGLDPTWYGLTVDGQLIASILNADGVNADWINTGAFTVRDANGNITFQADADTGAVTIKATDIPHQFFGEGVPTASNYPANQWTTDKLKEFHSGDLYTDTFTKKTYQYIRSFAGSDITFSPSCFSYSTDPIVIAFEYNGQLYSYGSHACSAIKGKTYFIPNTEYYIYWVTNGTNNNLYGWKVDSSTPATRKDYSPSDASTWTLPSSYTEVIADTTTPESEHFPYSDNLKELWTIQTGNPAGYVYSWVEVVGGAEVDPQDVLDEMTQLQIFNKLTNNGQAQGLYLQNDKLYLNFEYAVGQTLTIGGTNNQYGRLVSYLPTFGEVLEIAGNGLYLYPQSSGINYWEMLLADSALAFSNNGTLIGDLTKDGETEQPDAGTTHYYDYTFPRFQLVGENDGVAIVARNSNGYKNGIIVRYSGIYFIENLISYGIKSRIVSNTRYGSRLLYAYETPTPYFGDIGTGCIDENGEAVISIEDIFDETVNTYVEYSVFLQKEGPGDLWIDEKDRSYFVVKGTPGLKFSWELKAVQRGFENYRLDDDALRQSSYVVDDDDVGLSMDDELDALDSEDLFDDNV